MYIIKGLVVFLFLVMFLLFLNEFRFLFSVVDY